VLAQLYISILFLHVDLENDDATKRYYSTDADIKYNMMKKRKLRGFPEDYTKETRRKHRSVPKIERVNPGIKRKN
jgi:hypothetical protein